MEESAIEEIHIWLSISSIKISCLFFPNFGILVLCIDLYRFGFVSGFSG